MNWWTCTTGVGTAHCVWWWWWCCCWPSSPGGPVGSGAGVLIEGQGSTGWATHPVCSLVLGTPPAAVAWSARACMPRTWAPLQAGRSRVISTQLAMSGCWQHMLLMCGLGGFVSRALWQPPWHASQLLHGMAVYGVCNPLQRPLLSVPKALASNPWCPRTMAVSILLVLSCPSRKPALCYACVRVTVAPPVWQRTGFPRLGR